MKNSLIILIFLNYILSIIIFFISLFRNWELQKFMSLLIFSLLLLNIGIFLLRYLIRMVRLQGEKTSVFEMQVDVSENEAKELLKEAKNLEEEYKE